MQLKTTALFESHQSLGAKFCPFAGYNMPIQYTGLKSEVRQVRENCGMFDVSHMGEFYFEGSQAVDFVDFLITNEFSSTEIGKAVYSPLCRENGTIIDDLIVYKISNTKVLMCVNASNIDKDWNWISQFSSNYDCQLTNRSDEMSLIAVQGPKTFEKLSSIIPAIQDHDYYSVQTLNFENETITLARTGYTGEDGFEIFASHQATQSLWNKLIELEVVPCGLGARDVLRLEVCYPLYGNELSDNVTPLDSGLKWTVKLDKDKFSGKEALKEYKPQLKLRKITLDKGIPRAGYKIFDSNDKEVGSVTSGTMSVTLGHGIGLALVNFDADTKNGSFNLEIRGKKYPINISTKAFYNGGHK